MLQRACSPWFGGSTADAKPPQRKRKWRHTGFDSTVCWKFCIVLHFASDVDILYWDVVTTWCSGSFEDPFAVIQGWTWKYCSWNDCERFWSESWSYLYPANPITPCIASSSVVHSWFSRCFVSKAMICEDLYLMHITCILHVKIF